MENLRIRSDRRTRTRALSSWPVSLTAALIAVISAGSAHADETSAAVAKKPATTIDPAKLKFFESKVRPLLIHRCYDCHSTEADEQEGGLLLDSSDAIAVGGTRGPAVISGDVDQSLIIHAIEYKHDDMQMPPDQKLPAEEIEILRHWVAIGAPDPRRGAAPTQNASPLDRDAKTHWAFVNPAKPAPPRATIPSSRDVIDDWAADAGIAAGVTPNGPADAETMIRRLYYDLTGLPPTAADVAAFVADESPSAYPRLVDRLLASPAFGERFGRHWMDIARYADTIGYATAGKERRILGSERFRDWAINAFASDMPYDEMIMHQLAGDRTDPNNDAGNLDAMGFITVGRKFLSSVETLDDRIDVISRGLLGLTVACARCHDHKFDPIATADYYSLYGVLSSSEGHPDGPSPLMLRDRAKPKDQRVMIRGQRGNLGEIAPRQYLVSLQTPGESRFTDGSGRFELARRIASADNPLTARVMVNRLWGSLVGAPMVGSASDFGFRTEPPAVPEILEDLAVEFASDWSIKRIIRRIVLTRVYRQSSQIDSAERTADPQNQWLARANRKRKDFESLRDSMLAVADRLSHQTGGEPVEITSPTLQPRRTVYAKIDRQNLPAIFRTFDFASPDTHSPGRYFTTVPQQALYLLNNAQSIEVARLVARRVRNETGVSEDETDPTRLRPAARAVFRTMLGRDIKPAESEIVETLLQSPASPFNLSVDPRSLWQYGTGRLEKDGLTEFTPFPVFRDGKWQIGKSFPDPSVLSYASISNESGHTGGGEQGAVVRRWTAPNSGIVQLSGMMGHRSDKGDGVQCHIYVAGKELFSGRQKSNNRPYKGLSARIEKGQTVDLVAGAGETTSYDTFFWRGRLSLRGDDGEVFEADTVKDFSGPFETPKLRPLDRLQQLAHTLLMCNEFVFVD